MSLKNSRALTWLVAMMVVVVVSGCGESPDAQKKKQQAEVEKAVDEVSQVSGESEDDSATCGKLKSLLGALPQVTSMDGLSMSYRGCESPMTANLQFEDGGHGIYYTVSVLRTDMADLPGQGDHWQGLLDMNRQAIESLISTQKAMMAVGSKPVAKGAVDPLTDEERARLPRQVRLPNGAEATIYNESQDWTLVSLMKDRYVLRIDLLNYLDKLPDTDSAQAQLLSKVAEIDFSKLP